MTKERAIEILPPEAIQSDGSLFDLGWYLSWNAGGTSAVLDGEFSADDLEAIACWMRNSSQSFH